MNKVKLALFILGAALSTKFLIFGQDRTEVFIGLLFNPIFLVGIYDALKR